MTDAPSQLSPDVRGHNKWLLLIAIYKLGQALLFIALGVGALRLLHKDIQDELTQLIDHLRFNPESRLINFILVQSSIIDDRMLRRVSAVLFAYAGLGIIEGVGLYLEKVWGEYLTLFITGSFLPWEVWEVIRRLTWIRASLLVLNVLVFLYLLKVVTQRVRLRRGLQSN
ncbi:MAG: DUF2127 domain-containing protein [Terracidiphilus sp.]|jgi:uncharacterized membrane protein (DUF2068 family)